MKKKARVLGYAFLFQGLTSLIANAVILGPVLEKSKIEYIVSNIGRIKAGIVLDSFTAIGIIALGCYLYLETKSISKSRSLIALSLYISEATILLFSKGVLLIATSLSLGKSVDYNLVYTLIESADLIYILHLLPFGIGAVLFYSLLGRSSTISKGISLWGVISVAPFIIGAPLQILGSDVPFYIYIPYVPFEFFTGIYLIVKPQRVTT